MDDSKPYSGEKQTTWGTWEELLLASAVHRFGTHSWDAVAAELRSRSSSAPHLLTSLACKRHFHDLRRRFTQDDAAPAADEDKSEIPWLDQLRQRRLDELRRELLRYDHSIVSLQSKVERLREEREQSLRAAEKSDLEETGEKAAEVDIHEGAAAAATATVPENRSPAKKDLSGEVPARDDRSSKESNTSDLNPGIPETGAEPDVGPVEKPSELAAMAVEDSCNGSSDSVAKEEAVAAAVESAKGNSGESVAESIGGRAEEAAVAAKESPSSSEVQSTASLSRKAGDEPKPVGPDRRVEEPDQEDQSPAIKRVVIESQPSVGFLEILRSHKFASFFERRLHSQESPIYSNIIRKHVDLEMVQARLEGGWYSRCRSLFFRDLLLICNNARVFFGRKSPEYKAACELQLLVSKEMALQSPQQDPPPKEETPAQPAPPMKPESETSDSLVAKSKLSLPLNACRKRSSLTARASTSSSGPDRKKDHPTASLRDVKPALSWKQKEESSDEGEKVPVTKKRRKETPRSSTRNNANKAGSSRSNTKNDGDSDATAKVGSSSRVVIRNENAESKAEIEKKNTNNASDKKRSAANFLSRIKRTSLSNKESLPEPSKTPDNNRKGGRAEQRKNGNGRGNTRKEQASSRRGSGGRQAEKEQDSPNKKNVGRHSKRAAPPTASPAKRARRRG